ncbi:citrate lyase beta subunit, partial [Patescibacteria group bacterium]|nr:citrate lyase beta subunit [Patescibacteria group bacterium]MBU4099392.1 citrate lyase beta subunit [Patescibacteria group bacterium]
KKGLLDRFETRKIVFTIPAGLNRIRDAIIKANNFELLWLENKRNYYERIFHEDESRIKMLKSRVA